MDVHFGRKFRSICGGAKYARQGRTSIGDNNADSPQTLCQFKTDRIPNKETTFRLHLPRIDVQEHSEIDGSAVSAYCNSPQRGVHLSRISHDMGELLNVALRFAEAEHVRG